MDSFTLTYQQRAVIAFRSETVASLCLGKLKLNVINVFLVLR